MNITRTDQTELLAWIAYRYPGKPLHELVEWRELNPVREDTVYVVWKDQEALLLYTLERQAK